LFGRSFLDPYAHWRSECLNGLHHLHPEPPHPATHWKAKRCVCSCILCNPVRSYHITKLYDPDMCSGLKANWRGNRARVRRWVSVRASTRRKAQRGAPVNGRSKGVFARMDPSQFDASAGRTQNSLLRFHRQHREDGRELSGTASPRPSPSSMGESASTGRFSHFSAENRRRKLLVLIRRELRNLPLIPRYGRDQTNTTATRHDARWRADFTGYDIRKLRERGAG